MKWEETSHSKALGTDKPNNKNISFFHQTSQKRDEVEKKINDLENLKIDLKN
jgi:hypothetical protein